MFRFNAGKISLEDSEGSNLSWRCELDKDEPSPEKVLQQVSGGVVLDLTDLDLDKCTLHFPKQSEVKITGDAGKIEISEPHYQIDAKLDAGQIEFEPADDAEYNFHTQVMVGKQDEFVSSTDAKAYSVTLNVQAGSLEYAD